MKNMNINSQTSLATCPEEQVFESVLSLDNQSILELGCGDASLTRIIATGGSNRHITAMEVDAIQHNKNLLIDDLPMVTFTLAGSENIPAPDNHFDTVFMFKSLHHVPVPQMNQALTEIRRVLKPGGIAYISEPVFAGDFNEVLRLFHNEQAVREAAFKALEKAVNSGQFELLDELFFNIEKSFPNFEVFHNRVISVTHTQHQLSDEMMTRVKQEFDKQHQNNQGNFLIPIRVDLLRKAV